MQIFLSHSSNQKPLIREIRKQLPEHLGPWLDEQRLLIGDELEISIEMAIRTDSDYVLLFIDSHSAKSEWVEKEIQWSLKAEKEQDRTILLPIVLDSDAIRMINVNLTNRKYLKLNDYNESTIRSLSQAISGELFALVCRDLSRLRKSPAKTAAPPLNDADASLKKQASIIRSALFPYREGNPISIDDLRKIFNSRSQMSLGKAEFDELLRSAFQRNLVTGFEYDGHEAYLREENSLWKSELNHHIKEKIGRISASLIKNGMSVFFDAGSTTEEIVRILCTKIENRTITRVSVATTSVKIAEMISECCLRTGCQDELSSIRLYLPGGQIRLRTQAIVSISSDDRSQVLALGDALGNFDLGFVGVNGVDPKQGFTTHLDKEASNKRDILAICRKKYIAGDSSKVGLRLENSFAQLSDDITFIVDDDTENTRLTDLKNTHGDKLLLV